MCGDGAGRYNGPGAILMKDAAAFVEMAAGGGLRLAGDTRGNFTVHYPGRLYGTSSLPVGMSSSMRGSSSSGVSAHVCGTIMSP